MESSICFINILTQRLCFGLVGMHYRYCDDNPEATSWSQINLILYFPLVCFRNRGIKIIDQSLVRLHTEKMKGCLHQDWYLYCANFARLTTICRQLCVQKMPWMDNSRHFGKLARVIMEPWSWFNVKTVFSAMVISIMPQGSDWTYKCRLKLGLYFLRPITPVNGHKRWRSG